MLVPIIIVVFFLAIGTAFGMLFFRAWQIRTSRVPLPREKESDVPELSFQYIERTMLYITKHLVQTTIFIGAKYWFIARTKTKKIAEEKLPKIYDRLTRKKQKESSLKTRPSFFQRAVLESKVTIRKIKQKIEEEHR